MSLEDKKEAVVEYLSSTESLVTKGRIRLDIIESDEYSVSLSSVIPENGDESELDLIMNELVDEDKVGGFNTSSKGPVYYSTDRDLSEFSI